jgi:TRAP-type C4-dicarboxylate transport system substrate-binding protein
MVCRAVLTATFGALVLATAACGGAGVDKAGGQADTAAKPEAARVTLRLLTGDGVWAPAFADAVTRLSGGAIRIKIQVQGQALIDYERRTVEAVRAGRGDLGSVGARVWDTMGVTSLRALVAPFLVDSVALQKRVLESTLAARILAGVDRAGVVGLALLPGPLRRPLGLSRDLVGPEDYEGAAIGIRYGGVARATFRALGATPKGYRIGSLPSLDGAELDLDTIGSVGYDAPGSRITANVVLWARPQTIFANRDAFSRLTPQQQDILRRAGREALAPELKRIAGNERSGLAAICERGRAAILSASPAEITSLQHAVQSVYAVLARDAETRSLIAGIRRLRAGRATKSEPVRCPSSKKDTLEGSWRSTVSGAEMLAGGASAAEAATYAGSGTLELKGGRWVFRGERATATGIYSVDRDAIRLTLRTCTANPCDPGMTTHYAWSLYRDTLSLTRSPGRPFWPRFVAQPLRRVR